MSKKTAPKNILSDVLNRQIKELIQNAPDLATVSAVTAIALTLKTIALNQKHPKYFLLQSPTGNLVLTTLSQVSNPKTSKNVIYAYPSAAIAHQNQEELIDAVVKEFETIPLLFQFLGIIEIDSLIFADNLPQEVERQKLYDLCQAQIKSEVTSSHIA
jgi:hypothetical protein